ncbi:MAG TPA: PadR family transcriptional regulator [Actinomycetes bacterium]
MRSTPQPAGPFDPHDFGFAFGDARTRSTGSGHDHHPRRRSRHRRRFRETMLAMAAEANGPADEGARPDGRRGSRGEGHDHEHDHDHDHEHGHEHGRGRGRGRRGPGGRGGPFGGPGGPGFGGPGSPGFGGFPAAYRRGPKAGRGDIRAGVLVLLAEQPRHGYEIIRELAERSGGVWRPSPGSIYPTLKHLAHEGLVRADKGEGRRVFELTDEGRAYVEAHAEELAAPWESVGADVDDAYVQLSDLTQQVVGAVVQVGQAGTESQVEAAAKLLTETRRALYRLLAEDPAE